MQDIDFDEIDRAVSSASGKGVVTPAAPVEVAAPVVETNPDQVRVNVSSSRTAPSPASRRGAGRFMDVVHPSSDMRPQATPTPARAETVEPAEPEVDESAAFHWTEPVKEVTSVDAPTVEEDLIDDEPEDVTPLESPFITDAKVEKRPLGAFSSNESELPLLEDFPAPKVAEEKPVEETPLLEAYPEGEDAPELLPAETKTAPVEAAPSGPTSITQQYEEKPSSTAQSTGSIYDTDAYHKPVMQSGKKNSGVLIAVWVVALIVIGGGIGAAIYFVFLPMLS